MIHLLISTCSAELQLQAGPEIAPFGKCGNPTHLAMPGQIGIQDSLAAFSGAGGFWVIRGLGTIRTPRCLSSRSVAVGIVRAPLPCPYGFRRSSILSCKAALSAALVCRRIGRLLCSECAITTGRTRLRHGEAVGRWICDVSSGRPRPRTQTTTQGTR